MSKLTFNRSRFFLLCASGVLTFALGMILAVRIASSCFFAPAPLNSETVEVKLNGSKSARIEILNYEPAEKLQSTDIPSCQATVGVPLSAFPSARVAMRPADFTASIRDVLEKWKVDVCSITVWFDNDTGDEISEEESCLIEVFRFKDNRHWSIASEASCFDQDF